MTSRNRAYAHLFSPTLACALFAIALILGALAMPRAAFAMPAFSGMHTTTQPDGTQVSYYVHGDESFSYFTAEDGSLLQRDPETGALHYVIDNGDGTLSLGAQANGVAPLAQDAQSSALATAEVLSSDGARDAYRALEGISGRSVDVTPSFPLLTRNTASPLSLDQDVIQLPESIPLLTIVVGFNDEPYRDDYDWTQEMFTGQYSTSKFWSDASNGTFTFSAAPETSAQDADGNTNQYDKEDDGVVHVSLDMPHGNWGGFETDEQIESMVEMFVAAFEAADAYVDFSAFDKNGDAKLTTDELALCFVIAGRETSFDGDNNHSIWAHAWSTGSASELFGKDYSFVADGISTSDYIAMGESQGYRGQALVQNSTTTLTHELGHYLGLPDLYDSTNETGNTWSDWKVFGLSIMDYGSWGSNIPITSDNYTEVTWIPTRLDPLCSYLLGFTSPIEISEAGTYDVQSSRTATGYQSYVIQVPGTDDQFYFVENRLPKGFDKGLCGIYGDKNGNGVEGGIVVWHFDAAVWDENTWNNTVNVATHRPALMPVYVEFANDNGDIRPSIWQGFRTLSSIEDLASTDCIDDRLKRYSATDPDNPDAREASGVGVFALTDAQDLATFELAFSDTAQDDGDGLTVLFTNDVHGAGLDPTSDGLTYASVAALEKDARIAAGSGNVTLVDAGDAVQGNAIATLSEGDIPLQAMLESGYDLMVPGNHEFDYGTDRLLELAQQAEAGGAFYLATNIQNSITDEPLLHSGSMQTYLQDGEPIVVAFIGIATPETLTKSRPSNFQDENGTTYVDFYGDEAGEALYDRVQSMVDKACKGGADYVVAVGHLGNQGVTPRWSSKEVIANTSGIDVLIDGHSHEQENEHVANAQGDDVLLVQTGTQLSNIGKLTLGEDGFDAEFITADDYTKKDAAVTAALESYQEEFAEILNEQVGSSQAAMPWEDENGLRLATVGETNLGDLVADAYRSAMGADIGLVNAGGLRAPLEAGELTYGDILSVQPFGNSIVMAKVTGQQLLDALEMGARLYPESCNGLIQVSGMTYEIDASVPSSVVTDASNAFVRVDGKRRVKNVTVGGSPIDPEATYTVASHNFMLVDGGDGMSMFKGSPILADDGITDVQALIDYIQRDLDGTVGEGYLDQTGEGRIKVIQPSDDSQGGSTGTTDDKDDTPGSEEGTHGSGAGSSSDANIGSGASADESGGNFAATGDSATLPLAVATGALCSIAALIGAGLDMRGLRR